VEHFHVVGTEVGAIGVQGAVDELDRSGVAVFGEEADCLFSCLDFAQNFVDGTVHKKGILDFVALFFVFVSVEEVLDHAAVVDLLGLDVLTVFLFLVL